MSSHQCAAETGVWNNRLSSSGLAAHLDRDRLAAIRARRLDHAVDVERRADPERVPGAVRVPPATDGLDAVGSRHSRERIHHPQLVCPCIQDKRVLLVQPPPAGDHLVRITKLGRRRRTSELDESSICAAAQLEVGVVHPPKLCKPLVADSEREHQRDKRLVAGDFGDACEVDALEAVVEVHLESEEVVAPFRRARRSTRPVR
jgi:hypothetical protein